ncbi:hypothetical protein WJX73_000605 [Symbiochloris irregularis]|uniref:peptidylprolyl isomerase n=1 Tax=Symbiochloris irregularis TaxID=706552 RepID=A0AAW1NJ55_9CHLO
MPCAQLNVNGKQHLKHQTFAGRSLACLRRVLHRGSPLSARASAAERLLINRRECISSLLTLSTICSWTCDADAKARKPSGDWTSPGLASPEDPTQPKFLGDLGGVKVQELSAGQESGPAAENGDTVVIDYVLRRNNGYFIYATVEGASFQPRDVPTEPFSFQLGSDEVIPGLQTAVTGMHVGGRRRCLVAPEAGYEGRQQALPQPPTFATQRQLLNHTREPLLFELQLLSQTSASTVASTLGQCQVILGSIAAGDGSFDKDADFSATISDGVFSLSPSALTNASEDVLYVVPAAQGPNYAPLTAASASSASYCYDTTTLLPEYNPMAVILPSDNSDSQGGVTTIKPAETSGEVSISPVTTLLAFGYAYGLRADSMAQALGLDVAIEASTYNGWEEFQNDPTGQGATFYKVGIKLQNLVIAGATFLTNSTETYASFAVLMEQSIGRAALNASNFHWDLKENGTEAALNLQDPYQLQFIILNAGQYVHASKDWTLPSMLNQLPTELYAAVGQAVANLNMAVDDVSSVEEINRVSYFGQNRLSSLIEDLITSSTSVADFNTATSPSSISSALSNTQVSSQQVATTAAPSDNNMPATTSATPTTVQGIATQASQSSGSSSGGSGLSGGAIAGIVIGCVVGAALIALVVALLVKSAASGSSTPLWGRRNNDASTV